MIDPQLQARLEPVAQRHRRLQLRRGLALCWVLGALAGAALIGLQSFTGFWFAPARSLLICATVVGAWIVWWRCSRWQPDLAWIARQVEAENPDLQALLLTAIEQEAKEGRPLGYLQQRVINEAIIESLKQRWTNTVPASRLMLSQTSNIVTLALFCFTVLGLRATEQKAAVARLMEKGVSVIPGDTEIERGNSLVVLARFGGPLPPDVQLVIGNTPESTRRQALVKSLDDPVFGGTVPEVAEDFHYHIEYGGQRTRDFTVKVFEHPKLERADARLTFPAYTSLPEKRIEDTRRISAVEGSTLQWSLQLNKPVTSARLLGRDKSVVPLAVETNKAVAALKDFPLEASQSYELQLVDAEGRTNKVAPLFVVDVLKNRTPELKITAPRGDQRPSPIEEIAFQAEAWDDFGLRAYGFAYTVAGKETEFIELGTNAPAKEKRAFMHTLKLEDLHVQADELVSYFLWADDVGPDGEVRRTASDMFFAEVRPFEEIFRQGQAPEGGEGQQGQQRGNQATKLADLQKQIINATWNLQRQSSATTRRKPLP